jgi:hypothetical protein
MDGPEKMALQRNPSGKSPVDLDHTRQVARAIGRHAELVDQGSTPIAELFSGSFQFATLPTCQTDGIHSRSW